MIKEGIGLGTMFYGTGYGNGFPDVSKAEAVLRADGKVAVHTGATEVGQGAKTAMTQIACEVLGLKVNDIILISEDTSNMPDSGTAAASRQTYNTGNAVKKTCEDLREKIKEEAKLKLNLNTDVGLKLKDGYVYVETLPEKSIALKDLAKDKSLKIKGSFTAQTTEMDPETGQGAPYWPYTFGACAVKVSVDTLTGEVNVLKAVFTQDVGRAINPSLVEGQMDGGFSMALGYALLEDINVDNGKIKNDSFTNYLIPTSLDMIDIDNILIEDPENTAPYGAKGVGEPVMIPVTPAILNAIYDAVKVRITEIPVTPSRVLKELNKSKK
ncbi:MAG: nicotinate dehydrogenase medium molybdopterin subunit [Firmicutes bacterium]|nr:nicotinate dehydrogenase medium molybdopterin subunit [Bacillota bacterium]